MESTSEKDEEVTKVSSRELSDKTDSENSEKKEDFNEVIYTESDSLKNYMKAISAYEVPTIEEEHIFAEKIKKGDQKAKDEFVCRNLRFVVKIAHDFKGLGLPLQDLISEGNIGLERAVTKYDPAKGAKLSSYASWWIKQSMRRAIANQGKTIRIPIGKLSKISQMYREIRSYRNINGKDPEDSYLIQKMDIKDSTLKNIREAQIVLIPFDKGLDKEDPNSSSLEEIIEDEKAENPADFLGRVDSTDKLLEVIELILNDREKKVIKMRYGIGYENPHTLEEVATLIKRTRERVRQVQVLAETKLKKYINSAKKTLNKSGLNYDPFKKFLQDKLIYKGMNEKEFKEFSPILYNHLVKSGDLAQAVSHLENMRIRIYEEKISKNERMRKFVKNRNKGFGKRVEPATRTNFNNTPSLCFEYNGNQYNLAELITKEDICNITSEQDRTIIKMCTNTNFKDIALKLGTEPGQVFSLYTQAARKIHDYVTHPKAS